MRNLISIALTMLALLFTTIQLNAQTDADESTVSPHAMTAKVLFTDYAVPNGFAMDSFPLSNGIEVGYWYNITDWVNIGVPIKVGLANVEGHINRRTMVSADLALQFQYYKEESFVVPYVMGGAGYVFENFEAAYPQFPVGAGLNFKVGKNAYLNLQGEYRLSQEANRKNLQYGAGFWFRLGAKKYEESAKDTDGDGISDLQDECPTEAGLPSLLGCPDRDGDGVADKIDECPDTPGPAAALGCPDTDSDGIADNLDQCPDEAGTADNNGCPSLDKDGDGIADDMDDCPDLAGPLKTSGCPDSDGDGLADNVDECPNEAGPLESAGCPKKDSDGDGILDEMDKCPDVAGPAVLGGCPDTDGDGILDKNDACPEQPGLPANNGCPDKDSDGDGILDSNDECPDKPGKFIMGGCPDTDGDGLSDKVDQCPDVPGPKDRNGCPNTDKDGDGVQDKDDKCPDVAGPYAGCPDTDGDGVHDGMDKCPATFGPVTNNGCPEIKQEEKEVLEFAAQAVVFETGQASLKAESYAILDQVADRGECD
ncbi:MAG: thrombospondin type 3 repeat-containing protein, partial [Phaeodactylibacter sp.]|nr:thrombospondin type 3 repeat-containing protein [Phaeodactylibacter sp.]